MPRARWTKPSCLIMLVLSALLLLAIAWLASGWWLRTPSSSSMTATPATRR